MDNYWINVNPFKLRNIFSQKFILTILVRSIFLNQFLLNIDNTEINSVGFYYV
jgi:hypothetical protein